MSGLRTADNCVARFILTYAPIAVLALLVGCGSDKGVTFTFTETEKAEIQEAYEDISVTADAILLEDDPIAEFERMISTYEDHPVIDDAWVSENSLYIRFQKGGVVSLYDPPDKPWAPYLPGASAGKMLADLRVQELVGNYNALLINQLSADEHFVRVGQALNSVATNLANNGYSVTTVNNPDITVEFMKTGLDGKGVVWISAHGMYDGSNTWILTGEPSEDGISSLMDRFPAEWRNGEIAMGMVPEKRGGQKTIMRYFMVSQKFINANYGSGIFPKTLVYLDACQIFKSTGQMGEAFVSSGAQAIVGWTESQCKGHTTGKLMLDALLGGQNLSGAMARLPSESKVDFCARDVAPDGARLTFFPPGSGGDTRLTPPVEKLSARIVVSQPTAGSVQSNRVLTLAGRLEIAEAGISSGVLSHIDYGTVEVNGITTLLEAQRLSFSQPIVINSGSNSIRIFIIGVLESGLEFGNQVSASEELSIEGSFPALDLWTELRWNMPESDVDFHLLPPGAHIDDLWTGYDCFFNNQRTEWGGELDVDDVDGWGPEHITVENVSIPGTYRLFVHYYDDDGQGGSDAFVSVSVKNGSISNFGPLDLRASGPGRGDVWEVCRINFPGGDITPVEQKTTLPSAKLVANMKKNNKSAERVQISADR